VDPRWHPRLGSLPLDPHTFFDDSLLGPSPRTASAVGSAAGMDARAFHSLAGWRRLYELTAGCWWRKRRWSVAGAQAACNWLALSVDLTT
jgi:hypothetical protein